MVWPIKTFGKSSFRKKSVYITRLSPFYRKRRNQHMLLFLEFICWYARVERNTIDQLVQRLLILAFKSGHSFQSLPSGGKRYKIWTTATIDVGRRNRRSLVATLSQLRSRFYAAVVSFGSYALLGGIFLSCIA